MNLPSLEGFKWSHQEPRQPHPPQNILLSSPLLDDVLAGYFRPDTDRFQRQHTLGRLLVASFQKGRPTEPTTSEYAAVIREGQLTAYEYEPSWGGGVVSRMITRSTSASPLLQTATGLFLRDPESEAQLSIGHNTERGVLRVNDEPPVQLELGHDLAYLRAELARKAEKLFR